MLFIENIFHKFEIVVCFAPLLHGVEQNTILNFDSITRFSLTGGASVVVTASVLDLSTLLTSVLRLQTGVPTDTIARRVRVKRVGRGDGARCFCFFLVVLACENGTSNFSLFSSLPPCNAIFRFHAIC